MFCPKCATSQSDDLKFCKSCGANLSAVRQAVTMGESSEKFDWSKTWVADMLLSKDEQHKRKQERDPGLAAEKSRHNEIKAGVILSFVGIGLMIFLYVFMNGLVLSGNIPPGDAEIIRRIWVAGMIPFFVGLGMLTNGLLVSKKFIEIAKREMQEKDAQKALNPSANSIEDPSLSAADWYASDKPSVTEHTTRQLKDSS